MDLIKMPVLILGAGGHAGVLIDCLKKHKYTITGITDPDTSKHGSLFFDIKVIGSDEFILQYNPSEILLVNGLGSTRDTIKRSNIYSEYKEKNYVFLTVIHPSAIISDTAVIGEGAQIMAGAVIQPGCSVGENTIVNTGVTVDHDCTIGKNVHLAPGVTLSGNINVADGVHIGSGATVIQGIRVGEKSTIGAGSLVLKDLPAGVVALGVPAKVM